MLHGQANRAYSHPRASFDPVPQHADPQGQSGPFNSSPASRPRPHLSLSQEMHGESLEWRACEDVFSASKRDFEPGGGDNNVQQPTSTPPLNHASLMQARKTPAPTPVPSCSWQRCPASQHPVSRRLPGPGQLSLSPCSRPTLGCSSCAVCRLPSQRAQPPRRSKPARCVAGSMTGHVWPHTHCSSRACLNVSMSQTREMQASSSFRSGYALT